ncbi:hypothetical protein EC973_000423 [Apophysomyces ossiformis]|uniref:MIT domain-containing protein n=1 Tax=Apophysomyces ossiformis TaxID=679940 RepID=A0A8H7EP84_9FUNG|nr:hypothetical protein EC973_000423 [Apophysomyces ossiformis]
MSHDASPLSALIPDTARALPSSSPPTPAPQPPSSSSSRHLSRVILRTALQKANSAVLCDSSNDVAGAIDAYTEAINLLNRVLETVDKDNDRRRLQEIHDSYSERIQLLTALSPKSNPDDPYEALNDDVPDDPKSSWLSKPAKRKYSRGNVRPSHVRRTTSTSSIDSLITADLKNSHDLALLSPPPSARSGRNFGSSRITSRIPAQPPPGVIQPSKSTPVQTRPIVERKAKRRSNGYTDLYENPRVRQGSVATTLTLNQSKNRSSTSSTSSTSSACSTCSAKDENLKQMPTDTLPTMALPPLPPNEQTPASTKKTGSSGVEKEEGDDEEDEDEGADLKPQIAIRVRTSSLPKLHLVRPNTPATAPVPVPEREAPAARRTMTPIPTSRQPEPRPSMIRQGSGQQPNIRLPSMDTKMAACETLMGDIARLEQWTALENIVESLKLVQGLEEAVDLLQTNMSKKLKRDSMVDHPSPTQHAHESKKGQSFMSWGTKLSKSVERMNAFSLTKAEDQYRHYTENLQKLFLKIHILEDWIEYYTNMKTEENSHPQCDVLLQKLIKICDVISVVVGGFVLRDVAVLLGKWLKRGGSWANE